MAKIPEYKKPALEWFFMGFCFALVLGISYVLYGLEILAKDLAFWVGILVVFLTAFILIGIAVLIFRNWIFEKLKMPAGEQLVDLVEPFIDTVSIFSKVSKKDTSKIKSEGFGKKIVSWYAWISLRKWIILTTISLFGFLLGLLGEYLMHEQNKILKDQKEMFEKQIELQGEILQNQQNQWYSLQKTKLLSILYDPVNNCQKSSSPLNINKKQLIQCPLKSSLRARQEAIVSFSNLEKNHKVNIPDLSRVNVSGTVLNGADLSNINLFGANFSNTALIRANLHKSDISESDFSGAKLESAILSNANLNKSILSKADMKDINLSSTEMIRAELKGAILINANLSRSTLDLANLLNANLTMANLNNASLRAANLTGANISGVDLTNSDLSEANISGTIFSGSEAFDSAESFAKKYIIKNKKWKDLSVSEMNKAITNAKAIIKKSIEEVTSNSWAWDNNPPKKLPLGITMPKENLCDANFTYKDYMYSQKFGKPSDCHPF